MFGYHKAHANYHGRVCVSTMASKTQSPRNWISCPWRMIPTRKVSSKQRIMLMLQQQACSTFQPEPEVIGGGKPERLMGPRE